MQVRVKLKNDQYVLASVYKDDTPTLVAERVIKNARIPQLRDKKIALAQLIESQINSFIANYKYQVDKDAKAKSRLRTSQEQAVRERRLHMAS